MVLAGNAAFQETYMEMVKAYSPQSELVDLLEHVFSSSKILAPVEEVSQAYLPATSFSNKKRKVTQSPSLN